MFDVCVGCILHSIYWNTVILFRATVQFIMIPFLDCATIDKAIPYFLAFTSFRGAYYATVHQTFQDISPTFYKSLLSLSWTITLIGHILVPLLMGYVGKDTIQQWDVIYLVSACIVCFSISVYVIFVEVDVQRWDPEYAKSRENVTDGQVGSNVGKGEPWYILHSETNIADLFRSREAPTKTHRATTTRSIESLPHKNVMVSILGNVGLMHFGRMFDNLRPLVQREVMVKYGAKDKQE